MATIRRHPVPRESYEPDRPLNDLGRDQLQHFIHIAEKLPEKLRDGIPSVPSPEDGMASSRFIAVVTERLLSTKQIPKAIRKPAAKKASTKAVPKATAKTSAAVSPRPASKKRAGVKSKTKKAKA